MKVENMKTWFRVNIRFGFKVDIGKIYILGIIRRGIVSGVSSNCGNFNSSKDTMCIFGIYKGDISASNRNEAIKNNLSNEELIMLPIFSKRIKKLKKLKIRLLK